MELETVGLDFETYYDSKYSLKRLSTSEYVRDRRFKVHCVAVARASENFQVRTIRGPEIAAYFATLPWDKIRLVCHNMAFDGFVLAEHYGIRPARYFCTMAAARHWLRGKAKSVSLTYLCKFWNLRGKTDALDKTKGLRDIPDDLWPEFEAYASIDVRAALVFYSKLVGHITPDEQRIMDITFRMFCDPVFEGDLPLIREGFKDALRERIKRIDTAGVDPAVLRSNDQLAELLESLGVEPPMKMSPRVPGKMIYAFAKSDEEFTDLLDHENEQVAAIVAARLAVKSTGPVTRALRMYRLARTGLLAVCLNVWGAIATDRWSGGNKMNFQNFKRKSKLRRAIRARAINGVPHHVCVADSSNIEARGTAWYSQQEEMLAIFRNKGDPYNYMASQIYGRPVNRKLKIIQEDGTEFYPDELEGFVGKQAVLGLGYRMGWMKFQATCRGFKIALDDELCVRTVSVYRTTNYKLPPTWEMLDNWGRLLCTDTNETFEHMGTVLKPKENRIWFPNGTSLYYPDAMFGEDEQVWYRYKGSWRTLHGGKLLENIIQKYSRDVIAWQLLNIAERYRIGTMSHDEIVWVAPTHEADEALAWGMEQMSIAPPWAQGWPLGAEGAHAEYYCK